MFPVEKQELREQLEKILQFHINDSDKRRILQSDGTYTALNCLEHYTAARSQMAISSFFRERYTKALDGSSGTPLKVIKG